MPKFPGPTYNRVIDTDPQIVSVGMKKTMEIGSRMSAMPKGGDVVNGVGAAPSAPEMTISHVKSK